MKKKTYFTAVVILILSFCASYFQFFYTPDRFLMDKLYLTPSNTDNRIRIIAIDEKTLNAYGPFNTWSREKSAELVTRLNSSAESRPSVIGFDVMFIGSTDEKTDAALANACKIEDNVITAVNIVNETVLKSHMNSNQLKEDPLHISLVEKPYNELSDCTGIGFANTIADDDSYIRRSILCRTHDGETIDSFSYAVYKTYCRKNSLTPYVPDLGDYNEFSFCYSGKPGTYETISLVDVLDGTVDTRTFKDCIVLVGAYAPGMQDAFNTPTNRSEQMYGVEIHANIIEAFMEEKTYHPLPSLWSAIATGLLALLYYLILTKSQSSPNSARTDTPRTFGSLFARINIISGTFIGIALIVAELLVGRFLFHRGMELPLLTLPVFLILIYAFQLIGSYIEERMKRKQIVSAFKKYVAPQIVDELSQKEQFEIALGGENRDIAVLFVDIRGFTPLSESLEPEQVVKILNEYLALTTDAIFRNSGTLDKFIGDATMAIFNAPFDLDDYVYRAVCTARDIVAGSSELQDRLYEQFGKTVRFGIGVHCGPAIVGNIGCDVRMDYTAIGDTVNTAARLESNAKGGQILISDTVLKRLENRIAVSEVGTIPLKGKSNEVMVYQLDQILS